MAVTLTVLGSADAFNAGGRGHSCYLLEDGAGSATVDFGPTAMASLKRLGREANDLDAVYLTHLHGDHFGGLQTLLVDAYYRGFRTRPLLIAGPPGTRARVNELFALCYRSIAARPPAFALNVHEYEPGQALELAGRKLTIFQADHQNPPDEVACVLRIEVGGRALAFSGDTGWTPALVEASKNTDLFVCECSNYAQEVPQHITWTQLKPHLGELSAKKLVLTHLSEEMRAHADDVRRDAPVFIAEDHLRFEL